MSRTKSIRISQRIKQRLHKHTYVAESVADGVALWDAQGTLLETKINRPGLVFISGADCTELYEFFSVKSYRELSQAVALFVKQLKLPEPVHFWVNQRTENGFFITICSIDTQILDHITERFKRGALIIPEQLALQASGSEPCDVKLTSLKEQPSRRYIADKNYQLKMYKGHSAVAGLLSNNVDVVALDAAGLADTIFDWPFSRYLTGSMSWVSATDSERGENRWQKSIGAAGVFIAAYLVLSSAYLAWQEYALQRDFEISRQQLKQAVTLERTMTNQVDEVVALSRPLSQYQSKLMIFDALSQVDEKILLHNMSIDEASIELRGATTNATNMYETLRVYDGFSSVEFTSPVRQSRGAEQFSLRIEVGEP